MLDLLKSLRSKVKIGVVGGSDIAKQREQLGEHGTFVARQACPSAVVPALPQWCLPFRSGACPFARGGAPRLFLLSITTTARCL